MSITHICSPTSPLARELEVSLVKDAGPSVSGGRNAGSLFWIVALVFSETAIVYILKEDKPTLAIAKISNYLHYINNIRKIAFLVITIA